MPRTVRLTPVPPPPPAAPPRPPRGRHGGVVGVALLAAAAVLLLGHVLLSGAGLHSWDRTSTPPAQVRLTAGATYFLSTADGPAAVPAAEPLACTWSRDGSAPAPLGVTAESSDSRAVHAVARFVAPTGGELTIACSGGVVGSRPVFVDDADDAPADLAGLLLLLGVLAAVPGVGLVLGALYRRGGATRGAGESSHRERARADVATGQ